MSRSRQPGPVAGCLARSGLTEKHVSALRLVLLITAVFMLAEVAGGVVAKSLALLADAGHMLTDVAAIGLALFASRLARRPATREKTYGYLRLEILAALVNGTALFVSSGGIVWEAVRRLGQPPRSPATSDSCRGLWMPHRYLGIVRQCSHKESEHRERNQPQQSHR